MKNKFYTGNTIIRINRWLFCSAFLMITLFSGNVNAQLSGTKNIPGDYATLAAAISDLNTQGVTAPGVTLNLLSGNPETAPAGGYVIGGAGTAILTTTAVGAQVTIQGNGNTITASAALTVAALNDAIFKIVGADYITIDGFILQENAANTVTTAASNNMTEWGIALLYVTTTNGAQNNTIQNNTISLNRTYQNTFGIYSNSTHTATAVSTSATATGSSGGNSGLKVYGNNVSNVNHGIVIVGPTAAADAQSGIDVGGAGGAQSNIITNYGTTGTFSSYANVSGTVNGILVRNSNGTNISFNTVTSSIGGVTSGTLNGIHVPAASATPTATFTNNINSNTISLQSGVSGAMNGILYPGGSASTTSTLNVNNNNFTNFNYTVASTGAVIFISVASTNQNTSISNNTFTNISFNANHTGSVTLIGQSFTASATGTKNTNNNSIVTGFSKAAAGGTVTFILDNGSTVAGAVSNCQNNNFSNVSLTGATILNGISYTDGGTAPTRTVTGNTLSNITGGTSAINMMNFTYWNGVSSLSNNTISNVTGQGNVTGLTIGSSANNATSITISNNSINSLSSTGAGGIVNGITCSNTSTAIIFTGNTIRTLSSTGASAVNGITVTGNSPNVFILKNTICDLSSSNASPAVNGIRISSGGSVSILNNLIGDLRATSSDLDNSVIGINIAGGTAIGAYYNTINLSTSSSGTNFGSSAIYAVTTSNLTMNNNILVNNSISNGTGLSVAYRRSTITFTSYNNSSDRNIFFAPTIFSDGTNSFAAIGPGANTYKNWATPADANSYSELPPFVSTNCGDANYLHVSTSTPTSAESGGVNISGITDDFDAQTRQGNPGYTGAGTAPDVGADEIEGIPLPPCAALNNNAGTISGVSSLCNGTSSLLSITGYPAASGLTFQWKSGTTQGVYPNTLGTLINQSTGSLTNTTYYIVVVTCTNDGSTATTAEHEVLVKPYPSVSTSPTSGSFCKPGGSPITVSALGNSTSYTWSPESGLDVSTGSTVIADPLASTVYTVTGTLNDCSSTATASITVLEGAIIESVTATPSSVCSGNNSELAASGVCFNGALKITEVTNFRTGTGATSPYPAYVLTSPDDVIEISNLSTASLDVSGLVYELWIGTTLNRSFTIPASTILPSHSTLILALGPGTDSPADRYFVTGGTSGPLSSTTLSGHILKQGSVILDVVALNSYVWPALSGVTVSDWTGNILSSSGAAGVIRTASVDNNNATDWEVSTASLLQTIGTYNAGYTSVNCLFDYSWTPATFLSATTGSPVSATSVTATTTYTVTITNGNACTATGTVTINVGSAFSCTALTVGGADQCEGTQTVSANPVGGTAPFTYVWTEDGNSFGGNTQTITASSGTHTYNCQITDNCGNVCNAGNLIVNTTPLPVVAVNPTSGTICSPPGIPVTITASGAGTYEWSPVSGLSESTGATVVADPTGNTTYTVTGTLNGCSSTATSSISRLNGAAISSVTATPSSICANGSSTLDVVGVQGGGVANYNFSGAIVPGAFVPIGGGTPVSTTTSAADFLGDTKTSVLIPLGFNFNYAGNTYSEIKAMSDGYISFNPAATSSLTNNLDLSAATQRPLIAPLWEDLDGNSGSGAANYITTGSPGSRVFTIEWINWQWIWSATGVQISFQVKLYEADGKIEFIYRQEADPIGGTPTASIGITDIATGTGTFLSLDGSGVSPGVSSTTETATINAKPATDQVYTFTPPSAEYTWSPGTYLNATTGSTVTATNAVSTVTYTVTATAQSGCTATGTVTLHAGETLTCGALTTSSSSCVGLRTVTANPSGGGLPYSYAWTEDGNAFGGNTQTITASVGTHTYNCVVSDNCSNTCSSGDLIVTTDALPVVAVSPTSGLICNPNGADITITASGATDYTWSPTDGLSASTGSVVSASPSATTSYTVTGTDANGCVNTASSSITVSTNPYLAVSPASVSICNGASIGLNVTDAFSNAFTYTTTITIPTSGTTVGTSDPYPATLNVTGVPDGAILKSVKLDGLSQTNLPDMDVLLQSPNGTNVVLMSDVFNTTDATGLNLVIQDGAPTITTSTVPASGTYGPSNTTTPETWVAPGPGSITQATPALSMFGSSNHNGVWNLFIVDDASGDVGSLTSWSLTFEITPDPSVVYTWSPVSGLSPTTGVAVTATPAGSTVYTVTGTNAAGCSSTATSEVLVGSALICDALTLSNNSKCASSDFTATANPSGGGIPYTYSWSDGSTTVYPSSQTITANLAAGSYTLTCIVTDNCGVTCSSSIGVTVNTTPAISVSPSSGTICMPGGSAVTLTASGGTSYTWSPSAGLSATTGSTVTALPGPTTAYTVTGTDANGCSANSVSTISISSAVSVGSISATPSSVCSGGNSQLSATGTCLSGALKFTEVTNFRTGTGATSPYPAYVLSAPDDVVEISNISNTAIDVSGLVYELWTSTTLNRSFTIPASTTLPAFSTLILALGPGTDSPADLYFVTGGTTGPLSSTGLSGHILKQGSDILDAVAINSYVWPALSGVTVSDWTGNIPSASGAAGVIRTASVDNNNATDWEVSTASLLQTIGTYNGGYAALTCLLDYSWSPSTYLTTTTGSTVNATGIVANTTYTVTISESGGCSATGTVTVLAGDQLICSAATTSAATCANTDFTVTSHATGGGQPYTYSWSDGSTTVYPATESVTANLPAGSYTFTCIVTDACLSTCASSVSVTVNGNPTVGVTPTSGQICNPGGAAIVYTASGATTYTVSPLSGITPITTSSAAANPVVSTVYTVVGTDGNGCTASATVSIQVGSSVSNINPVATPPDICPNTFSQLSAGGELTVPESPAGYSFSASSSPFTPIVGGTPVSTTTSVADFLGDTKTSVAIPLGFTFNYLGVGYTSVKAMSDGYISFNSAATSTLTNNPSTAAATQRPLIAPLWDDLDGASGTGAANYITTGAPGSQVFTMEWLEWQWNYLATGATISFQVKLYEADGKIEFYYRDEAGSINSPSGSIGLVGSGSGAGSYYVLEGSGASPTASSTSNYTTINAEPATDQVYTFIPPANVITYSWQPAAGLKPNSFVQNPETPGLLTTTVYTVTATNNGCSSTATVTVFVEPLSCSAATASAVTCAGNNFTVTAHHTGGGAPYSYAWSDGIGGIYPNTAAITANLPAGVYTFDCIVTDNCGNTCSSSVNVTVSESPTISVSQTSGQICNPNGVAVTLTGNGGQSYTWAPSNGLNSTTGGSVSALPASNTTYTVIGTSVNGCTSTGTAFIQVGYTPSGSTVTANPTSMCPGGTAELSVSANCNSSIIISEFQVYNIVGSGRTDPFPAFIASGVSADEYIEVSNISTIPVDVSGVVYEVWENSTLNRSFTYPNGTIIPPLSVSVIALNTGTDDPGNLFFYTGGANNTLLSSDAQGHVLRQGSTILDVVTLNSQVFSVASGVTAADWSGPALSPPSTAGVIRTNPVDHNLSSDWILANSSNIQHIGTYDNIYTVQNCAFNYSWNPASGLIPGPDVATVTTPALNTTTTYSVTLTTNGCSSTSTVTVNVVVVDDNNPCTNDFCDTQTGTAFHSPVDVDDGDPCTTDGCDSNTGIFHTPSCGVTLNSSIFIQGYYSGGGLMEVAGAGTLFIDGVPGATATDADTVTISAMDPTPPYALVQERQGILHTDGTISVTFNSPVVAGNSYYMKLYHRNSVETWSAAPVLMSPVTSYNFSTAATQAFSGNQADLGDGNFAIYTGDINHDGAVDGSDFLELDPSIQNGDGGYAPGDLNGDGAVDGSDFLVLDPNIQNGIGAAIP